MSEANGPYTVGTFAGNFVHVIRDGASVGPVFHSSSTVEKAAVIANLAHHHALAAQADRVKQLEEALRLCERTLLDASSVIGTSALRDWISSTVGQVRKALTQAKEAR